VRSHHALTVDVSSERVRAALSAARATDAARATLRANKVGRALLSITFVSGQRIAALNLHHFGRRAATDVIALGFRRWSPNDPVIGDIYIAPTVAARSARDQRIGVREELTRLVVHGTLHVLGYDHPADDSRSTCPMWAQQEKLVRRLMARRVA
jgi:probable rRNA maturation factor